MVRGLVFLAAFFAGFAVAPARAAGAFGNWAAIVVAGDTHAHDGSHSDAFDNARRDVGYELMRMGFPPANVLEFSEQPDRFRGQVQQGDAQTIGNALWSLSNATSGGCMIYFSSHGTGDGIVLGNEVLTPGHLSDMVDNACNGRPTVVVLSACYSGAFVDALKGPDRFVFTAARADRSSFGCGTDNKYPYFDTCFLQAAPGSHDFPDLARATEACVTEMEQKTGMAPPSEPQLAIGADVVAQLPRW